MNLPEGALQKLYGSNDQTINSQLKRYSKLTDLFNEKFDEKDLHFFSTPGRTELGGNHTDHNNGRVLAASVNLDSIAVASKNNENKIVLYSEGFEKAFIVDLSQLSFVQEERATTNALIRGIAAKLKQLGYRIGGFNACITSNVLPGSGLSSSASVEVLIGSVFNALYNDNCISPIELAKIGQFAENEYFGKPCGLMDQLACAIGGIISIDFENPQKPIVEKVAFDFDAQKYSLLVIDTGGNHTELTEDYASVPKEMKSVAKELGMQVCRSIDYEDFIENVKSLRDETGDRALLRAIHFLGENDRVLDQVNALRKNDFFKFLELLKESGNSSFKWLQNIYSIKNVREQGISIALALTENFIAQIGEGACRVHGGGFAGTIQAFLPNTVVDNYKQLIEKVFGDRKVMILSIRPYGAVYINGLKCR